MEASRGADGKTDWPLGIISKFLDSAWDGDLTVGICGQNRVDRATVFLLQVQEVGLNLVYIIIYGGIKTRNN